MRKRLALLAIPAVLLAACGGADTPKEDGSAVELPNVSSSVEVVGEFGDTPEITLPDEEAPTELQERTLVEGGGDVVQDGDLLIVNYVGQVWGGDVFDSSFDQPGPAGFPIGEGAVISGWDESLVGEKVGSRVLMVVPPDKGYGTTGQPEVGIESTDTLVFVVDVVGTYGADAGAQEDAVLENPEVDVVVDGDLGADPTIRIVDDAPVPTALTSTVLARGSGPEVTAGTIVVQYEVVTWSGEAIESSWERGTPLAGQVTTDGGGPFDAIIGTPVGSRVLVYLPGDPGPADTGVPASPAESTYVVLVDVIAQPTN